MRIEVKNIKINGEGNNIVNFISPYGGAEAMWKGSVPTLNKAYEVEIQIDDKFIPNQNILKGCIDE